MRPPDLLRALACVAVLFSLWSCARTVGFNDARSSEPSSLAASNPGDSDSQVKAALSSIDLKELRLALKGYEERDQKAEELPPDTLIELPRLCFILGEFERKVEGRKAFEKGRHYAELLCRREPARVEGHYWLALNLCGIAETSRPRVALSLLPVIISELELALDLDETYDQAGAHRVIGRIYSEAPGWPLSVGDLDKSLYHLRRAVEIAPENSTNHLYLAETLIQLGMDEEAQRELEQVLIRVEHSPLAEDLQDDYQQAARLILLIKAK